MLNRVSLIGNLGRDPEIRHLEGGAMVTKFPVATNENYQDRAGEWQTRTEWHDIVCWGPLAERTEKTLKKGSLVYIEGKISKRKWQDKDGNDRYTTEIVCNSYRLLEKRDSQSSGYDDNFPGIDDQFPSSSSSEDGSISGSTDDDLPF